MRAREVIDLFLISWRGLHHNEGLDKEKRVLFRPMRYLIDRARSPY
jgi:hypothetical protein